MKGSASFLLIWKMIFHVLVEMQRTFTTNRTGNFKKTMEFYLPMVNRRSRCRNSLSVCLSFMSHVKSTIVVTKYTIPKMVLCDSLHFITK